MSVVFAEMTWTGCRERGHMVSAPVLKMGGSWILDSARTLFHTLSV